MKKLSAVCLVALLLAGLLSAGGESDSSKVKLTFVESLTSPERTLVLQSMIDEYESLNPDVEIELISPPYEQADNKITMMLNSNQEVDIVESRDNTLKQYVNNGKLVDLTPYIAEWDEYADLLDLTVKAAHTVDNTPYLIPEFFYVKGLLVRTDIIEKYGIELPETMDEFYAAVKEITGKAPGQYGVSFRGKNGAFKISDIMMLGDVGNVNPDNFYESLDGGFFLDNEAGIAALEKYVDMFKTAAPSDAINWGYNEQVNGFVSGTAPFLFQDPDAVGSIVGQLDPSQYTAIPVPVGITGKRYVDYGFAGLSIATNSKHPDEAWDFIKFMASAEQNSKLCKAYGPLPVHGSTYEQDEYFSSGVYTGWADELNSPDTVFVAYPFDSPKYPAWTQVQEQTMQALLLGNSTVEEAIKAWAAYWND